MRVGLVGCVKAKQPTASTAEDLYVSTLFARRRAWCGTELPTVVALLAHVDAEHLNAPTAGTGSRPARVA